MRQNSRARVILMAGPTAGGKSAAAMALAKRHGGIIINADAMQVYADLRILTSRPPPEDEAAIRHRLYGFVAAANAFSVARWLEHAKEEIAKAVAGGKVPIITGGTGLYFRALEYGLSPVPPIPLEIRQRLRAQLQAEGTAALHNRLRQRDPEGAAILEPGDGQRIIRALEVLEVCGMPLRAIHASAASSSVLAGLSVEKYLIMPTREELYRRCDTRFRQMINAGALEEATALLGQKLDPDLPAMKAIGVRALKAHLDGETTLAEAMTLAQRETRNYAKRQTTWARGQMADWQWLEAPSRENADALP